MNCADARQQVPALLYGDLIATTRADVEKHLAECAECRRECRSLQDVRKLLDEPVPPAARVDLARLYRDAAGQDQRRLGKWRRLALAASGIAALLAVAAFGMRLEVRVERHQLILRWGSPALAEEVARAPVPQPRITQPEPKESAPVQWSDDQQQLFSQLIRALADDLQGLERRQRESAADMRLQLRTLLEQNVQRCAAIERNVDALYLLSQSKGE
jgi:hypothetical protein